MPSPTDYAGRLKEEVERVLTSHRAGLQNALHDLRTRLTLSLERLEQLLASMQSADFSAAEILVSEATGHASEAAARIAKKERDQTLGLLARFSHDIRLKETQEEILNLLLDAASHFAPQLALFVTREDGYCGWSSRGFPAVGAAAIGRWSCGKGESRLLQEALDADGLTSTTAISGESKLKVLLGPETGTPWHAFPLRAIGRPVAVLLAAPAAGKSCDLEALCILLDLTGSSIENLALKILQDMRQAPAAEAKVVAPAAEAQPAAEVEAPTPPELEVGKPEPERSAIPRLEAADAGPEAAAEETGQEKAPVCERERVQPQAPMEEVQVAAETIGAAVSVPPEVVPELEAVRPEPERSAIPRLEAADAGPEVAAEETGQEKAPVCEREHVQPEAPMGEVQVAAETIGAAISVPLEAPPEPLAEPGADVVLMEAAAEEALAAEQAAEPLVAEPAAPEPARPAKLKEVQPMTEEEKLHSEARRFARLLVSEIKLYNEQQVMEGRVNRNLYLRLKRDVDRSRDIYEQRVSRVVARTVDYFHDEVIRILAANDPGTLGRDYPGPRVAE